MRYKRSVKLITLSMLTALVSGCGSSGSDTQSNAAEKSGTGYYLDSAISGVKYVCGIHSGITGSDGSFTFEKGKSCTFTLGELKLRSVEANALIDKVKVIEEKIEVATLLQTLDADGNPENGITIPAKVVEKLAQEKIAILPETPEALQSIYEKVKSVEGYHGSVKTVEEARQHLEKTQENLLKELLAGKRVYNGEYSDEDDYIDQTTFNADMTSLTWKSLIGEAESGSENFRIEGKKIIFDDGKYIVLVRQSDDYLLFNQFKADGTPDGTTRLYFDRQKMEAYYNRMKNGGGLLDFAHLGGTTVYEVYFDGDVKNIGMLEFLDDDTLKATGIEGEDAGKSVTIDFTAGENSISSSEGRTTFTMVANKPYFMTGEWVSADGEEHGINYYFQTEAEARAFDPNAIGHSFDKTMLEGKTFYSSYKIFENGETEYGALMNVQNFIDTPDTSTKPCYRKMVFLSDSVTVHEVCYEAYLKQVDGSEMQEFAAKTVEKNYDAGYRVVDGKIESERLEGHYPWFLLISDDTTSSLSVAMNNSGDRKELEKPLSAIVHDTWYRQKPVGFPASL